MKTAISNARIQSSIYKDVQIYIFNNLNIFFRNHIFEIFMQFMVAGMFHVFLNFTLYVEL